jgi:hypothetical protein
MKIGSEGQTSLCSRWSRKQIRRKEKKAEKVIGSEDAAVWRKVTRNEVVGKIMGVENKWLILVVVVVVVVCFLFECIQ